MEFMVEAVPITLQWPAEREFTGLGRHEVLQAHLAGAHLLGEAPDMGAGAELLAPELAVQHRPAGADDGGHIAAGGTHQEGRGGLVAAGHQDHAVDGIAADRFLDVHRGEIAEQHGGRAEVALAGGEDGEFKRKAAGFVDAALHPFREVAEMRVAGRQLGPGVADADHGAAVEQIVGKSLVLHPASMQKAVLVRMAEPGGAA